MRTAAEPSPGTPGAIEYRTARLDDPQLAELQSQGWTEALRTVFEDGNLLINERFADIRARAQAAPAAEF